jgi:hypothetical protein
MPMANPALPIGMWACFYASGLSIWDENMALIAICQFWLAVCSSSQIRSQRTVRSRWLILDELALPRRSSSPSASG